MKTHLRTQNPSVRVSTGWAFANNFSALEHQILANFTDGLELSLTKDRRFEFYLDNNIKSPSLTVHLSSPLKENHRNLTYKIVQDYTDIEGFVFHPIEDRTKIKDTISNLDVQGIMMENLDSRTDTLDSEEILDECLDIMDVPNMTIDIQHLSEHYNTQESIDFIENRKDSIQQFHVSGRTGDNRHELLISDPENKKDIDQILEYISTEDDLNSIPLVIEGKYESVLEVKEEYEYLKSLY